MKWNPGTFTLHAELAVMSIFRDHGVDAGSTLTLNELESSWQDYGLREEDLPMALNDLTRHRLLRWESNAVGDAVITITGTGKRWFAEIPGSLEYTLVVMRRRQAESARAHGHRMNVPPMRRRADAKQAQAEAVS
jgi:hypothetical protein